MLNIAKWRDEAMSACKRAHFSAAAQRDCLRAQALLEEEIDGMEKGGAAAWAALTFVEDVCSACPLMREKNRAAWRYLRQRLAQLCEVLLPGEPGMDEAGTDLYLRLCDALEG